MISQAVLFRETITLLIGFICGLVVAWYWRSKP